MIKLKFKEDKYKLNESPQIDDIKYTLYDDNMNPLHQRFKCKDYLNDVIWYETNNNYDKPVFGFTYEKQDYKLIEHDTLYIGLSSDKFDLTNEECRGKLELFLNEAEDKLGFIFSEVELCENGLVIKFSNEWIQAPYLLSIFSLFLRVGLRYEGQEFIEFISNVKPKDGIYGGDDYMMFQARHKLIAIFKYGILPKDSYKKYESAYNAHNNGGIVSLQNERFKKEEVVNV